MVSQAQIEANRLNAQKSTGPRTAEGKARSSRNAITHGIFTRQVLLSGEDSAFFESFKGDMMRDLAPATALESMLAERIVACAWKLQRLMGTEMRYLNGRIVKLQEKYDSNHKAKLSACRRLRRKEFPQRSIATAEAIADHTPERLVELQQMLERSMYKAMEQLQRWQKARRQNEANEEDEETFTPSPGTPGEGGGEGLESEISNPEFEIGDCPSVDGEIEPNPSRGRERAALFEQPGEDPSGARQQPDRTQ